MNSPILSKSDILLGRTCPRCLWMRHNSTLRPTLDAGRRQAIQQGHEFAAVARREFPQARRVPDGKLEDCAVATQAVLASGFSGPLFEPAFVHEGVGVKLDVLYSTRGHQVMRELKASKRIQDDMLDDCAVQLWTLRNAGVPVAAVELGYVYSRYRKDHGKRPGRLVRVKRVTPEVEARLPLVPGWIALARSIVALREVPPAAAGHACEYPGAPKSHAGNPLSLLARGKERTRLQTAGYGDVLAIPLHEFTKRQNLTIAMALRSAGPYVSPAQIGRASCRETV